MSSAFNISILNIVSCFTLPNLNKNPRYLNEFKSNKKCNKKIDISFNNKKHDNFKKLDLTKHNITYSIKLREGNIFLKSKFYSGKINSEYAKFKIDDLGEESNYYIIKYLIKLIYSFWFLEKNILTLHASGMVYNNKAYIFSGPSGSGKSTILKKATENYETINDETILLEIKEKEIIAHPNPFYTNISPNSIKKKVEKIFFIHHSSSYSCLKISKINALKNILKNEFLMQDNMLKNKIIINKTFKLGLKLAKMVCFYNLFFTKNDLNYIINEEIKK